MNACRDQSCLNEKITMKTQMICPKGFSNPPNCLEDINECLLEIEPCKNGGQCINTIGSYYCQCNQYYQGSDCSIPIDPCSSNPCVASGSISCSVAINGTNYGYSCTCQLGHTGKYMKENNQR
jgi:Notch-like protein